MTLFRTLAVKNREENGRHLASIGCDQEGKSFIELVFFFLGIKRVVRKYPTKCAMCIGGQ